VQYFALIYEVVDDYVEQRAAYRDAHLALAQSATERGELLYGGALGNPVDGALLVFRTEDSSTVEQFARNDPYVTNGLVTSWRVRPWNVVVGAEHKGSG
jgi:uncharacterized protein